jgi:tetratricopeptide (TPR) repeat protein
MQNKSRRPLIIFGSGCLLVLFLALLLPRHRRAPATADTFSPASNAAPNESSTALARSTRVFRRAAISPDAPAPKAEEIVAHKMVQFGRNRRDLVHALAKRFNVTVPGDVDRFFQAVEGGRWEEIESTFNAIRGSHPSEPRSEDLFAIWRPIQEAWGAAREAHNWPAQKLLDYGDAVLGSLRPGMVYVGGTDPGAFITTMLNETTEGERHIIFTQNALASTAYLDHLNFLYGDRLAALTSDDNKRIYDEYVSDARKRFEHDEQFPDQPKQLLPGEDARFADGKFQITGQAAVMAINEKLFQWLMQKNPDTSFAMEESYPFKSTFANATALGALMELRVQDEKNVLTRERAAQSVDYWRTTAQQLLADTEAADSYYVRMAYSKLASSQAGLLLERGFTAEAEQAFHYAQNIAPTSPEAVFRYVNLLVSQNRVQDALPIAENAARIAPENKQFGNLVQELQKLSRK